MGYLAMGGLGEVLLSETKAAQDPSKNKLLYESLLCFTMNDFGAELVLEYQSTEDGYKAWANLCGWYDEDEVTLMDKFETKILLVPGVDPDSYINDFLTIYFEFKRFSPSLMGTERAKYVFLRNIHDPQYYRIRDILSLTFHEKDIYNLARDFFHAVQSLDREQNRKRPHRAVADLLEPSSKRCRVSARGKLLTVVQNREGFLKVRPQSLWYDLNDDLATWVFRYNRTLNLNRDPPPNPEGVTIL
mmetsp:Transcript_12538/g.26528  ORF Transcript_12538/g.26528 Transcript_12538/m.26528 type:complete len:245 (-) Transcript_12538:222-956(-)